MQPTFFPTERALVSPKLQPQARNWTRARLFGLAMIALGVASWWYNWHLATTEGRFYIKLTLMGPLGVFGGLLQLVRPDWTGGLRGAVTKNHKTALFSVLALVLATSCFDMYRLSGFQSQPPTRLSGPPRSEWSPKLSPPPESNLLLLGKIYQLGSFHQNPNPVWEFVTRGETVNQWTTILTMIDRPDAHTRSELDRVSEGVMANYKSHGGQILVSKTMQNASGEPYNYLAVAFEEPGQRRYEVDFVKAALGAKNVTVIVYGVHIGGAADYQTKAKQFLTRESEGIGRALASTNFPDLNTLPRRVF